MTKPNSYLFLRRLIVYSGGSPVYDQEFHTGPNIIHGNNGSGKSTILNFIFWLLGGDLKEWKEAPLKCDYVLGEFDFGGSISVLKRQIIVGGHPPIEFFWGSIGDISKLGSKAGFQVFPHARSMEKESFSQVILRAIGIPDIPIESGSNITIHQLLRLMYVDQLTPATSLFRREPFDIPLMRETIGNMMCGVFDVESLQDQKRLKELQKAIDANAAEIKAAKDAIDSYNALKTQLDAANSTIAQLEAQAMNSAGGKLDDAAKAILNDVVSKADALVTQLRDFNTKVQ